MTIEIPGYRPGTYAIDPSHSEVGFSVRHMMISKVKGVFHVIEGTIVAPENPLEAKVTLAVGEPGGRQGGEDGRAHPAATRAPDAHARDRTGAGGGSGQTDWQVGHQ